jgi:hypothetical protein
MDNQADILQLPDFLIADLYRDKLVIVEQDKHTSTKDTEVTVIAAKPAQLAQQSTAAKLSFLGNNEQKVLILVNDKEAVHLNEANLTFLMAILGACKLNLGSVAIVNHANNPFSFQFLKEELKPQQVIIFNVSANLLQLTFSIPHYQIQKHDGCSVLFAAPMETMVGNAQEAKLEKSKLWLSLKKMFNL